MYWRSALEDNAMTLSSCRRHQTDTGCTVCRSPVPKMCSRSGWRFFEKSSSKIIGRGGGFFKKGRMRGVDCDTMSLSLSLSAQEDAMHWASDWNDQSNRYLRDDKTKTITLSSY